MGRIAPIAGTFGLILAAAGTSACNHGTSLDRYPHFDAAAVPRSALTARFLGTSTIILSDGETTIMTDGFLSRPPLRKIALEGIRPDPHLILPALRKAQVREVAAIFVAHSHYDHAMDSAWVAVKTGAMLIGSESTRQIGLGGNLPEKRIHVVKNGEKQSFGKFEVTTFMTPHSPNPKFQGVIYAPVRPPAKVSEYREGGSYSFLVRHGPSAMLIVPSANFVPGLFCGMRADAIFLGIGGLGTKPGRFVEDYWRETVEATGARLVIPIHWDNFFRPLSEPLKPIPVAGGFGRAMKRILRLAGAQRQVRLPKSFEPIDLVGALPAEHPSTAAAACVRR